MTIEWSPAGDDGVKQYGVVNGVRLYTIRRTYDHAALRSGFPVSMDHRLPFAPIRKSWRTAEAAKEYAERHLDAAMLHLGYARREVR